MAGPLLPIPAHSGVEGQPCQVCGSTGCKPFPDIDHADSYPFLPGGTDPMATQIAGRDFVYATERVMDRDLGRVVYGAGDPVPMADAIKYGLVPTPPVADFAPEPENAKRGRRTRHHPAPAEDR